MIERGLNNASTLMDVSWMDWLGELTPVHERPGGAAHHCARERVALAWDVEGLVDPETDEDCVRKFGSENRLASGS
jgi:hypothetical protein